jgi:signal transduction histidine kinase
MSGIAGAVRTTLLSGRTYLQQVHLLLGAALALAFALVCLSIAGTLINAGTPTPAVVIVVVVTALVPPALLGLLPAVRQVEGVAAESLLGVRFPDGPPGPATTWPQRRRAAAWFLIHVTFGFVVGCAVAIGIPISSLAVVTTLTDDGAWWLLPGGILLVVGGFAVCIGLGIVAAKLAPRLLGPSVDDRFHALEERAARLSERTRLARELHDSVGHALSLVVVQAGAARKVRDTDPAFVDDALEAVEDAARTALTDLDQVLGLLRDEESGGVPRHQPVADLRQFEALVTTTRRAGLVVEPTVTGDLGRIPAVVSRESYRIVQESLTNALRHGTSPVTIRLRVGPRELVIETDNAISPGRRSGRRGRGLRGMRERAAVLGGELTTDVEDERWRLRVRLPLPGEEPT